MCHPGASRQEGERREAQREPCGTMSPGLRNHGEEGVHGSRLRAVALRRPKARLSRLAALGQDDHRDAAKKHVWCIIRDAAMTCDARLRMTCL
jgi:hypothetical protein